MRLLSLFILSTFSLFSISIFACSLDGGTHGKIVIIAKIGNPVIIGTIDFGHGGDNEMVKLVLPNIGLESQSNEFLQKNDVTAKDCLDTKIRFVHLIKYAHFLNRGRRSHKLS